MIPRSSGQKGHCSWGSPSLVAPTPFSNCFQKWVWICWLECLLQKGEEGGHPVAERLDLAHSALVAWVCKFGSQMQTYTTYQPCCGGNSHIKWRKIGTDVNLGLIFLSKKTKRQTKGINLTVCCFQLSNVSPLEAASLMLQLSIHV